MPALSQSAAEIWNTVSNLALVIGAVVVLAGTWGSFWTGNMKEYYANERISANEVRTAEANAGAARANEEAAKANERAARLEAEAEQARKQTAELQLALQAEIASRQPRRLTQEQYLSLASQLKSAPKGVVIVRSNFLDMEASAFAKDFMQAFIEAGYDDTSKMALETIAIHESGVFIAVADVDNPPPHAIPILISLLKASIPVESRTMKTAPPEAVILFVGRHP